MMIASLEEQRSKKYRCIVAIGLIINEYQIKYFDALLHQGVVLVNDTEAHKVLGLLSNAPTEIEHIILDDAVTFALYHPQLFYLLARYCTSYTLQLWLVTQSLAEFNTVLPKVLTPDTTRIHLAPGYTSVRLSSDFERVYQLYTNQTHSEVLRCLFEA